MTRKRKQKWEISDVFIVSQDDGMCSIGQILDLTMPNVVTCAFFDIRFSKTSLPATLELSLGKVISCVSVSREQLDYHEWKVIIKNQPVSINRQYWPNEKYRNSDWIGAEIYDAALVEDFLNAFYGLLPWDDWHDPNFLDELLITPDKKPKHLVYKNK